METQMIRASARQQRGKGAARQLRRGGSIPAIAYGGKVDPQELAIDPQDLAQLRKSRLGWNQPVCIEVDGGERIPLALLRDVQRHPISGKLLHADFLRLAESDEVVIRVPVAIEGKARGQETGAVLSQPRRELEIRCTAARIPQAIPVDVTPLELGDRIVLSQLAMPEGCTPIFQTDYTVVACVGRRGVEEIVTEAGAEDEAKAEDAEAEEEE